MKILKSALLTALVFALNALPALAYQSHEYPFTNLPERDCKGGNCGNENLWQDQGAADQYCKHQFKLMTLVRVKGFVVFPTDREVIIIWPFKTYHVWGHRDNRHYVVNND